MNIPDEAVEAMQKAEEETDPAWAIYWTQRSQALSQIALVEAQEAANEQARWGNIIAWMTANGHEPGPEMAARIIKAIGIEVAE